MLRLTVPLFLGFTLFAADGVAPSLTPIDLGTLGGSFSFPSGVNTAAKWSAGAPPAAVTSRIPVD
jgi:hypothetical protein